METAGKLGFADILNKQNLRGIRRATQARAIARAIIHSPSLLLADEPTGSLDSKSSRIVMETFEEINRTDGTTTMLVTHGSLAATTVTGDLHQGRSVYDEIHRGDNWQLFFQKIIDMLSFLGRERP